MKVGSNLCLKRKLATASYEVQMRSLLEDPLESDSDGSRVDIRVSMTESPRLQEQEQEQVREREQEQERGGGVGEGAGWG